MDSLKETQAMASGTTGPEQATLLLVDDEPNITSALARLFRPAGYRILSAQSGPEGLEILKCNVVDLVISDMRMPEMDGARFLTRVAEDWPDTVRILLTGYADLPAAVQAINSGRIYRYLSKPWEEESLKCDVANALERRFLEAERKRLEALTRRQNDELKDLNANLERKVLERTAELSRAMTDLDAAHQSLKSGYVAAISVFARLVEMRHGLVAGHARKLAEKSRDLALKMGMDEAGTQDVLFAGLLHDIGKLGLPDEILRRRMEQLTPEDRERLKKHPIAGQAVLMALEPLQGAARLIRFHCERYNGTGYPDGAPGAGIPLGAAILAVVDDYLALQDGTLQLRRMSAEEALSFIHDHSGSLYDPAVARAFQSMVGKDRHREFPEVRAAVRDLKPGMILTRDLIANNVVWLARGQVLDERLIQRMRDTVSGGWGELEVYVRMDRVLG